MESSSDCITGGTLMSTVDWWIGGALECVFKKDANPSGMGHWSYQTLVGKWDTKITIITGYHCIRNANVDSSVWTQEKIFMRDCQAKSAPHPRKQFVKDMISFINAKQSMNHENILNLDANKALGEESQGIAKIMRECDLVDLLDMPELESDQQLKDTYRWGNNR
jgi:hypothetical protein